MGSEVPTGWQSKRFSSVLSIRRGHDLPKRSRRAGEIPVLGSSGVVGSHDEAKVTGPTFVLGRAANIGDVHWTDGPAWPLNTTLYPTDFHGNDPRFLFYLMKTIDFTIYDSGSVQPMLNRNYVAGHQLVLPLLDEQLAIAEVLGSLDSRIEHLNGRQERLAGVADQLFSALRASADSTEPLGGWITLDKGTSYSTAELADDSSSGAKPLVNLGNFGRGRLPRWDKLKHYTGSFSERHRAEPGTVVVCATDMTNDRAVLGKALMVPGSVADAVVTLDLFIVRHRDPSPFREYATLLALNHEPYRRFLAEFANGTTVLRVPRDAVERVPMPLIDVDRQADFVAAVEPLLQMIDAARLEIDVLQRTRDSLLPHLVTGKLRVKDVDGFLARAGLT